MIVHFFDTPSYNVVVIEDNVIDFPNLIKNTQPGGITFLKTSPYCDTIRNHPVIFFFQFFRMDLDDGEKIRADVVVLKDVGKGRNLFPTSSKIYFTNFLHHSNTSHE
jgi:hypothetical protein